MCVGNHRSSISVKNERIPAVDSSDNYYLEVQPVKGGLISDLSQNILAVPERQHLPALLQPSRSAAQSDSSNRGEHGSAWLKPQRSYWGWADGLNLL